MARRVIRVNHHDRACARGHVLPQRVQVETPAMVSVKTSTRVIQQRVRYELHIVNRRQQVEERITGLRDQHLVARIAEQPEEPAISLAGAGGEHNLFHVDARAMIGIVVAHRLPRVDHAARVWIVGERIVRRQICKQIRVVGKATLRRVRGRQVNNGQAAAPARLQRARPRRPVAGPFCSLCKPHVRACLPQFIIER